MNSNNEWVLPVVVLAILFALGYGCRKKTAPTPTGGYYQKNVKGTSPPPHVQPRPCNNCYSGRCRACLGEGGRECAACSGRGTVRTVSPIHDLNRVGTCGSCNGAGKFRCGLCSGTGRCTSCAGTGVR